MQHAVYEKSLAGPVIIDDTTDSSLIVSSAWVVNDINVDSVKVDLNKTLFIVTEAFKFKV